MLFTGESWTNSCSITCARNMQYAGERPSGYLFRFPLLLVVALTMTITIQKMGKADKTFRKSLWTARLEFCKSSVPYEVYNTIFTRLLKEKRPL